MQRRCARACQLIFIVLSQLTWMSSLCSMVIGAWMLHNAELPNQYGTEVTLSNSLFWVGFFVTSVYTLAFISGGLLHPLLLILYLGVVMVLLLLEMGAGLGLGLAVPQGKVESPYQALWREAAPGGRDFIQRQLRCCAFRSIREEYAEERYGAPPSCLDLQRVAASDTIQMAPRMPAIYMTRPCEEQMILWVENRKTIFISATVAFVFCQVAGMVLAFILLRYSRVGPTAVAPLNPRAEEFSPTVEAREAREARQPEVVVHTPPQPPRLADSAYISGRYPLFPGRYVDNTDYVDQGAAPRDPNDYFELKSVPKEFAKSFKKVYLSRTGSRAMVWRRGSDRRWHPRGTRRRYDDSDSDESEGEVIHLKALPAPPAKDHSKDHSPERRRRGRDRAPARLEAEEVDGPDYVVTKVVPATERGRDPPRGSHAPRDVFLLNPVQPQLNQAQPYLGWYRTGEPVSSCPRCLVHHVTHNHSRRNSCVFESSAPHPLYQEPRPIVRLPPHLTRSHNHAVPEDIPPSLHHKAW